MRETIRSALSLDRHRRLDFYRFERDDTIDQEAQPNIGYAEGSAAYLRRLPEQYGANSSGLQIPYHAVCFNSHVISLDKHFQMTERVDNKPSRLNFMQHII